MNISKCSLLYIDNQMNILVPTNREPEPQNEQFCISQSGATTEPRSLWGLIIAEGWLDNDQHVYQKDSPPISSISQTRRVSHRGSNGPLGESADMNPYIFACIGPIAKYDQLKWGVRCRLNCLPTSAIWFAQYLLSYGVLITPFSFTKWAKILVLQKTFLLHISSIHTMMSSFCSNSMPILWHQCFSFIIYNIRNIAQNMNLMVSIDLDDISHPDLSGHNIHSDQ